MADRAVDRDGNVYEKDIDGLYLPKYGSFGREREPNTYGQPSIQHDGSGSPKEVRSSAGQPKESADGKRLFHPSTSGGSLVGRLAGTRFSALLIGSLLVGGLIAGLLYTWFQIKFESWDSVFWGISLVMSIWALSSEPSSSISWPRWWLTISEWPRKNPLNSLMFVVGGTLLLHWVFVMFAPGSTVSPTQTSNLSPSAAGTSSTPSYTAAATSVPQATPTVEPRVWVVGNTDGMGVYLRSEPRMSARVGAAYLDGTRLTQEEADVDGDGRTWKRVRAPDGRQGYVPAEYVLNAP